MGLMDTLRNALGLQRPLTPRDPEAPLEIAASARERLQSLPADHGIHLWTTPFDDGGRQLHVEEGPSQGPPPPSMEPLPITASDPDLHHLRGLILEFDGGQWALRCFLSVHARETPNPNGRLYLADRWLAFGRPLFFGGSPDDHPSPARQLLAHPSIHSILLRDNTLTVEREPGQPWDAIDRAVDDALRDHFLRCGHALTADAVPERDDPLEAAIAQVLAERIAPGIHRDGGDIELVGVSDGVVRVALSGACRSCPSSTATLRIGVERTLLAAFPDEITRVEQV